MAAVTTDIPPRWGRCRPRHLTVVPSPAVRPGGAVPAVYRRRRAMALVVVMALFLATWVALEALVGALGVSTIPGPASTSRAPTTITVAPGDTFWSIASRIQPQGDPRPLVDRLVAAHGGGVLQAGERLSIPRSGFLHH